MNRIYNKASLERNYTVANWSLGKKSYKAFSDILNNYVLFDFQCIDLLTTLASKQVLVNYDTGMGKTIFASALMKALHNYNESKSIFIMKASQLIQTPQKIREATGLKCVVITGEQSSINKFIQRTYSDHDILIISNTALQNNDFVVELYRRKHLYSCMIVDEIHEMVNYQSTTRASLLKSILPHFEYRVGLTATTITSSIDQLANAMYMLTADEFFEPRSCVKRMLKEDVPATSLYAGSLIRRTRDELGIRSDYRPYVITVAPDQAQIDYTNSGMVGQRHSDANLFKVMKGPNATRQLEALKRIVVNREDRGLIYIRLHVIRQFILDELTKAGVKVASIHGGTSLAERRQIFDDYRKGNINVIITSVTTNLDIEAEYVVFYEYTLDVYQMIGRADRGIKDKRLDIYFIVTTGTAEIDYFLEYVYNRSLLIRYVFRMEPNFVDRVKQLM